MPVKWILLVMENKTFRKESVYYAINLAKRINCSISVLMLAANADCEEYQWTSEQETVDKVLNMIKIKDINAQGICRYGDKASGLLKHLAAYPSIEAIIWGGIEDIATGRSMKKPDHWLAKIKTMIRCPVVSPTKKYKIR